MEPTRATWTDERLDDLAHRMDQGFSRVEEELRAMRGDANGRFDSFERRFDSFERRFDSLERRFDTFQTTILQLGGGMAVAILATLISVLLTRA